MTVSPGILLSLITRNTTLDLDYNLNSRGYFIEREDDRFEYYNQRGSGIFRANILRDFSILLRDEIIKDEEMILLDETLTREERRREYIRNIGGGELLYRYGEEREFAVGYLFTIMEYLDNILDNSEKHDFNSRVMHRFNVMNIGHITYRHSIVDYKRVGDPIIGDLYEDEVRGRFIHSFTPRVSFGLNYGYIEMHSDGATSDNNIHDAALEAVYNITRYLTAEGRFGMFLREQYEREYRQEDGLIYRAGIRYTYPTLSGSAAYEGGYGSNHINPERLQYYDYWRLSGDMTYHLIRDLLMLSGHGYYMVNIYPDLLETRRDYIWNAGGGISYRAAEWFLFSLEYNHTERDSNIPGLHYAENSYLARVTISYKYSTIGKEREQKERIKEGTKKEEE
ncbi:MAG: outer membrane beta-barrel protein [Nitrospirota bacterium]